MNSTGPVYREVQYYRELPPFTLLTVVGALFGWFLIIWVGVLGNSLGQLVMPTWLALAIGLPLGVLMPLAYGRLKMVTEVFRDRLVVNNGMSARTSLPFAKIAAVEIRTDSIHEDFNVRNVGTLRSSRIAYTVTTDNGVQLTLEDGRQFLIGSKDPSALNEAISKTRQYSQPEIAATGGEVT
jgi:hypothetical protein